MEGVFEDQINLLVPHFFLIENFIISLFFNSFGLRYKENA